MSILYDPQVREGGRGRERLRFEVNFFIIIILGVP